MHLERSDLVGVHNTEPAAFDHRRAAHPNAGLGRRDDQIGATEERRIAGEAATRCDADARHHTGQPRPAARMP